MSFGDFYPVFTNKAGSMCSHGDLEMIWRRVCSLMQVSNICSFSCFLSSRTPLAPDALQCQFCGRKWQIEGTVLPTFVLSLPWSLAVIPLVRPTYIYPSPALPSDLRAFHSYSTHSNIWPLPSLRSDLTQPKAHVWGEACQHSGLTQNLLSTSA